MTYTDLLSEDSVILDLQADSREQALQALAERLERQDPALAGRAAEIRDALLEREARGSTGQQEVGLPHVRLPGASRVSIAVAIHREGLDFGALDGEPVKVFFSVVRPAEGDDDHLAVLRWIAQIASHEHFVRFATQAESAAQVIELLSELSAA
ncbi:MAG: PTS sugar transporter subunit IIA [Planctomycetota bacterium]|nr:MAG: PTS sugar transporter subunit IIA [Planctomycetota bacterium]